MNETTQFIIVILGLFLSDVIGYAFWITYTGAKPNWWQKLIPFCWVFSK